MERMSVGLVEVKFEAPESMSFEGYGAVFGNVDAYGDVIEPGAFAKFLSDAKSGAQPWPAMLSQHGGFGLTAEDMTPIGVWTDLAEDGKGLRMKGELAATPRGLEMKTLMSMSPRPAIDGLSIGYIAKESEPRSKPEDPRRRLKRIDLIEVSPVTFPANRLARVDSVKSLDEVESIRDLERFLCDLGLSKGLALRIISKVKRLPGEPAPEGRQGDPEALTQLAQLLQRNAASLKA